MSYFTNIAVQNVNKGFVYITDLTWSLSLINTFYKLVDMYVFLLQTTFCTKYPNINVIKILYTITCNYMQVSKLYAGKRYQFQTVVPGNLVIAISSY